MQICLITLARLQMGNQKLSVRQGTFLFHTEYSICWYTLTMLLQHSSHTKTKQYILYNNYISTVVKQFSHLNNDNKKYILFSLSYLCVGSEVRNSVFFCHLWRQ